MSLRSTPWSWMRRQWAVSGGPKADTEAPTVPANLAASSVTAETLTLTWDAATDNVGVVSYEVQQKLAASGNETYATIGTPTATTLAVTGLTEITAYRFRVRALDVAGNLSAWSPSDTGLVVTTADETAPTVPANLAASDITETTLTLDWDASTDNVDVVSYEVEQALDGGGFAWLATVAAPTVTLDVTELTASTAYRFRVRALDAAGNTSGWGPDDTGLLATTEATHRTFMRLNGITQHAYSEQIALDLMPGDGEGGPAELASGYLCGVWIRGEPPAVLGAYRTITHLHSSGANLRGIAQEYVHSGGQHGAFAAVTRDGPTVITQGRNWPVAAWPDGQYFRTDGWNLVAIAVSKQNLQWTRYYNTARVGQGAEAGELTPFAGGVQPQFAPGFRWFLGARRDVTTGLVVSNSVCPGDFRAPFLYQLGAESWATIDGMIASIHAGGPAFDHGAAGAAGWWPGDGDTYPTFVNCGTAGAAWNLTLADGSQAMIMEDA